MLRGYNQTIAVPPRKLPMGDCGFIATIDPLVPVIYSNSQSSRCNCRNYWPNLHSAEMCACGHHACYHSAETTMAPATAPIMPSTPSTFLTIGAYASMMTRIARLEERLEAHELERRNQIAADKLNMERLLGGLRELDERMIDLAERIEEAEERLFGDEGHGVALEARLHDLEGRTEELEEDIEVIKAAVFEDEREREFSGTQERDIKEEARDIKQETSHHAPHIPTPPIPPPIPQERQRCCEEQKPSRVPPVMMDEEEGNTLEPDTDPEDPQIDMEVIFPQHPPDKVRVVKALRRRLSHDSIKSSEQLDPSPPMKRSRTTCFD
ncbi:hypothetical protein L873DRAFT_874021 [Choiromyces venosus 120613-1]|uniref:Uncharacterized protein n=1 Tax=Choiromyces venosus 120613-1 TaxID=1336337 RepID=A0A3N4K1C6_9PEZI|nr:hypothetical protein L873DRAFT_874021 [Choiromyces venosus 120613-1]